MGFCRNCGGSLMEGATFCARCGTPVERVNPAYDASGQFAPMGGPANMGATGYAPPQMTAPRIKQYDAFDGFKTIARLDALCIAQGALAIIVVLVGLFAPVLKFQTSSYMGVGSMSLGMSIPTVIYTCLQTVPMLSSAASALGGTGILSELSITITLVTITMVVLSVLGIVGLVGAFLTSARIFEGTGKSTMVTGLLMLPFSLGVLIAMLITMVRLSSIGAVGDMVGFTLWPWLLLFLTIACSVLGIVQKLRSNNAQSTGMYGGPYMQ